MIPTLFVMGFMASLLCGFGGNHNWAYALACVCVVCATVCAVMGV